MINGFIRFSKSCLSGHQGFYSNGFKLEWSFSFLDGFITNNDHQFFQESRYSKTWKHFFIIFHFHFLHWSFSLFKNISKIKMTKTSYTQVHLFHANADIKRMFTFFKSAFKNESIHEQKQRDHPQLVFYLNING